MGKHYCVSERNCATCEYWSGDRQPMRQPRWVDVNSQKAVCCAPDGPWRSYEKHAMNSCRSYTQWRYV